MIVLDCSSGGGQMLRTALALATVTGEPFRAENIRAGRDQPGLKNQHLACIESLEQLSGASSTGAYIGSGTIEFHPGKIVPRTLSIDIGTAGSITLLMQSLLLPCCLADGKVRLRVSGGTDTAWAMPLDYFINVVLPYYGVLATFKINDHARGFYPKGGGFLDLTIMPKQLGSYTPLALIQACAPAKIKGISSASSELRDAEVAKRQAAGAKRKIGSLCPTRITEEYQVTGSIGTVVTLWTDNEHPMGGDALGAKNRRAEAVGAEAAGKLLEAINSCAAVDCHLADNLIPLMVIIGGEMKIPKITNHVRSNIAVCERFATRKFSIDGLLISA
jgi:RNA 3'-phosphate cyclase